MSTFHYALLPSGFLLLGGSETAGASQDLFPPVDKKHRIYSRRGAAAPAVLGFGRALVDGGERRGTALAAAAAGSVEDLPREADRILLARFAPAGRDPGRGT